MNRVTIRFLHAQRYVAGATSNVHVNLGLPHRGCFTVVTGLTGREYAPVSIRLAPPRRRRHIVLAAAAVICVCALVLLAPAGADAASFTWGTPTLVNAQTSPIPSVSCATLTLCVAVSGNDVYTSTAPADHQWTAATIDPSATLDVVSCWGSQCVAIDNAGYVFWSQNPAGGAGTWARSRYSIDPPAWNVGGAVITDLSCGDGGWCVAVDAGGSVLAEYQTPIGGWHVTSYVSLGPDSLSAVSCNPRFCLAANPTGWVFATQATQGGAWPTPNGQTGVRVDHGISSVSCLSGGLCVLTSPHETATDEMLNPGGPASAWSAHWNSDPATYPQPVAVSCAASTLCVGINSAPLGAGIAIVSTSPRYPGSFTGPVATDQTIDPTGSGPLNAISCIAAGAGAQLCVVGDASGHLITGTYPHQ